jgi:hypothetical protein
VDADFASVTTELCADALAAGFGHIRKPIDDLLGIGARRLRRLRSTAEEGVGYPGACCGAEMQIALRVVDVRPFVTPGYL